jgi:MoCo/4Fe-4S cofactor protein with predicted Tat translocation signal
MTHDLKYWKSLRALEDKNPDVSPEEHEFMDGVTDDFSPSEMSGMSRKQFLALLAASAAFTAAGCSNYRDKGEIVPYTKKPEEITPGIPNYYASTCTGCSQVCGILIKTREGRPIKIDGNPDHPINRGKICAKGQASVLNLYDPFRLRTPKRGSVANKQGDVSWKQIDEEIIRSLTDTVQSGKEIAIVTRTINSPTTKNCWMNLDRSTQQQKSIAIRFSMMKHAKKHGKSATVQRKYRLLNGKKQK